jgi:hypothetical protein
LVCALLMAGGPFHVAGRIVPVIVDAVNGQTERAMSNISEELLKRFKEKLDSTPAVAGIADVSRVGAAVLGR